MERRPLGQTGIDIPVISFGAGPVSGLLVGDDIPRQQSTIERAIELGIDWFDTAATYGNGESERSLGRACRALDVEGKIRIATKVRLAESDIDHPCDAIRQSLRQSIDRLGQSPVTLLQLHNAITGQRGDEPNSITARDVLRPGGVLDVFEELKHEGLVQHIGLTGIGYPSALREVIRAGTFETIQTPYSLLNRSSGEPVSTSFREADYGQIGADCQARGIGVMAIRVFAAGALLGRPPSAHTERTLYFPLPLYTRDLRRAGRLRALLDNGQNLRSIALHYVLAHPAISTGIIGFGSPEEVEQIVGDLAMDPLSFEVRDTIARWQAEESL